MGKKKKGGRTCGGLWLPLILAFFMAAVFTVPAYAAMQDMWAYVYRWDGKMDGDGKQVLTRASSGITFKVLARNASTAETLYVFGSDAYTSLTNAVTAANFAASTVCNGRVAFRVDPTDSTYDRYVDLVVVDATGGYTAFVEDFDKYNHTIVIDERPGVLHHGFVWFDPTTTDETSTGITFASKSLISDVRVEVVTVASAVTIDVGILSSGTGGDADGFIAGRLLTTAGFPKDTGVVTAGTTLDFTAASTYGALLYKSISGSDAVASGGGRSYLGYVHDGTSTGELTYTAYSTTGKGYLHYWFNRLR